MVATTTLSSRQQLMFMLFYAIKMKIYLTRKQNYMDTS